MFFLTLLSRYAKMPWVVNPPQKTTGHGKQKHHSRIAKGRLNFKIIDSENMELSFWFGLDSGQFDYKSLT